MQGRNKIDGCHNRFLEITKTEKIVYFAMQKSIGKNKSIADF